LTKRWACRVGSGGGEHEPDCGGKVDAMARRDVDGGDVVTRSNHHPDLFAAQFEAGGAPTQEGRREGFATQASPGTPNGRDVEPEAKMAREAKEARIGRSMPVEHQNVWLEKELLPSFQKGRGFSKAEQAGAIGEGAGSADVTPVEDRQI
jgi:hypothetical protein